MFHRTSALIALVLAACNLPRDADDTLGRIRRNRVARVGIAEAPPWASAASGAPSGVEPTLVVDMLGEIGAAPRWVRGGESELLLALKDRKLDLVIGGLTESAPWSKEVAFTKAFYTDSLRHAKHVMAVAPGENA